MLTKPLYPVLQTNMLNRLAFIFFALFWVANLANAQPYACPNVTSKFSDATPDTNFCAPRAQNWTVGFGFPSQDLTGTTFAVRFYWDFDNDPGNFDDVPINTVTDWNAGSNRYEASSSFIYPKNGLTCTYQLVAQLIINGGGCTNAAGLIEESLLVWDDISNTNLGQQDIDQGPGSAGVEVGETVEVCLDDDSAVILADASDFNCTAPIEPEPANENQNARWVQWVYGTANSVTTGATTAEKIIIDGVEYTAADLPIYGVPEYLPAFVADPTSITLDIRLPAQGANVGEVFEVTMRSWNTCNPFDDNIFDGDGLNPDQSNNVFNIYQIPPGTVLGALGPPPYYANDDPIVRTFNLVIVAKPVPPTPNNQVVCNGAASPNFSIGAAGNDLVDWFQDVAGVPGSVITNSLGNNSLQLPAADYEPGGGIINTSQGVYTVWASYNANTGNQNCWSDPVPVTLTINEVLLIPGAFVTSTAAVCNNTAGVVYELPAVAGSGTPGGSASYQWRATDGSNNTVTDVTITPQGDGVTALVDFNLAAGFINAVRKVRVRRRYDVLPRCSSPWQDITVTVSEETAGGVLVGGGAICSGQNTGDITVTNQIGSIIEWQVNVNGGGFAVEPALGTANPINPVLTTLGTHEYQAVVQNGPCLVQFTTNTVVVTVNPNPIDLTADVAVIDPLVCEGGNSDITVDNTEVDVDYELKNGATTIQMIPGNGGQITFNTGPLTVNAGLDIIATKNDGTGCSILMGPFAVNVTPTLSPSSDMGPDQVICTGDTAAPVTGADPTGGNGTYTYQWQSATIFTGPFTDLVNGVGDGTPTGVTTNILSFGSTIPGDRFYRRQEFSGACIGVSNIVSIVVSGGPPVNGSITTGLTDVCEGTANVTYEVTGATDASPSAYIWTIPAPAVNSLTGTSGVFTNETSSISVDFPVAGANILITVLANNGCGPAAAAASIIVNSNKIPELIPGQSKSVCSGISADVAITLNPANTPAGTVFNWPAPLMSDGSIQGTPGVNVTADPAGKFHITDVFTNTSGAPITATYTVTPAGPLPTSCPGNAETIIVSISAEPVILPGQNKTVCAGEAVDLKVLLTPDGLPVGTVFNWSAPLMSNGSSQGSPASGVPASDPLTITDIFSNTSAGQITATYQIVAISPSPASCSSVVENVIITINPKPEITSQPVDDLQCETFSTTFSVAYDGPPAVLTWERSTDGGANYLQVIDGLGSNAEVYSGASTTDLTIDNLSSPLSNTLFRLAINSTAPGSCSIVSDPALLTVSPDATTPSTPSGANFRCQGDGTDLYFTTSNFAIQGYNWSVVPPEAGAFRDGGTGPGLGLTDSESITWAPEFFGTAEISVEAIGCSSIPIAALLPISVTVNPTPETSEILGGNNIVNGLDNVCVDQGFFYAVDAPAGSANSTYSWTLSPLDGNEPLLSDFGNLVLLDFQSNPWNGTLSVVETNLTCDGPPVALSLASFGGVVADAGSDTEVCEGQQVQLGTPSASGGSGAYIYSWAPAIGLDDPTVPQPMASPPQNASPITYQLTVTDANTGCAIDTDEVEVIVNTSPVLTVNPSVTSGCSRLPVDFDNNSLNVFANKWFWRLQGTNDENEVLTTYDASYEFTNNTTAEQVIEVVYQGSTGICTDEVVTEILVYPTVDADFTVAPGNILVLGESTITVTNNSINKASWDHLWDFGDGTTSTDVDPAPHEYTMFGDFDLSLTLTDPASGCTDSQSELIRVQAVLPVVDFEVDKTFGCRPLTVKFTNTSFSVDPNSFIWEITNQFGQNVATSREVSPTITFYDAGILNVTLSGTNPLGVVDSKTELELIAVYELPMASFNVTPATVYLPDQLLFTNNLSSLADEFMWDLNGDGEIDSELFEPTYLYDQEGFYDVSLIAINSATGCADTLLIPEAVNVVKSGTTDVPNAFFPAEDDGSGGVPGSVNSTFLPKTYGVEDGGFIMQIFDRWGHLLYESQDKAVGWNGRDKSGRLYASGVYVYKLDLRYLSGEHSVIVGDVSLMR